MRQWYAAAARAPAGYELRAHRPSVGAAHGDHRRTWDQARAVGPGAYGVGDGAAFAGVLDGEEEGGAVRRELERGDLGAEHAVHQTLGQPALGAGDGDGVDAVGGR